MNKFMNGINAMENTITTENGATAYGSTLTALYDMFALGGSYRSRSDDDCIFLFKKAFEENESYALKCLFYLRRFVVKFMRHKQDDKQIEDY